MSVLNQKASQERLASMKNVYVVRELVSVAQGEKDFRTHYECGRFTTYEAANQCAIRTQNQNCFPQKEEVYQATPHTSRESLETIGLQN
jgi:hypothetical protein